MRKKASAYFASSAAIPLPAEGFARIDGDDDRHRPNSQLQRSCIYTCAEPEFTHADECDGPRPVRETGLAQVAGSFDLEPER